MYHPDLSDVIAGTATVPSVILLFCYFNHQRTPEIGRVVLHVSVRRLIVGKHVPKSLTKCTNESLYASYPPSQCVAVNTEINPRDNNTYGLCLCCFNLHAGYEDHAFKHSYEDFI